MQYWAGRAGGAVTLPGINAPGALRGSRVSARFFDIFGVKGAIGRTFADGEDQPGKERVAILGHPLWESQFGSDPNVIGRSILLDGAPHTVIGSCREAASSTVGTRRSGVRSRSSRRT